MVARKQKAFKNDIDLQLFCCNHLRNNWFCNATIFHSTKLLNRIGLVFQHVFFWCLLQQKHWQPTTFFLQSIEKIRRKFPIMLTNEYFESIYPKKICEQYLEFYCLEVICKKKCTLYYDFGLLVWQKNTLILYPLVSLHTRHWISGSNSWPPPKKGDRNSRFCFLF